MVAEPADSKRKPFNWVTLSLLMVPVIFVSLIGLLWSRKFFEFTQTEASANVVAASLALAGVLLTSMVTLVGLLLKQSLDQRNVDLKAEADRRLALDAERNRVLQEEAEKRLKLEAAIRAVDLLGTDAGGDTNVTQRTGALFSLAHLGFIDLAIDLVDFMRPKDLIGPNASASLLDIALKSNDPNAQEKAAMFIRDHGDLLVGDGGFFWPDSIAIVWPQKLSYSAKNYVLYGLVKAMISLPIKNWDEGNLNSCVVLFAMALRAEEDERLKAIIALLLGKLLRMYTPGYELYLETENLSINDLRTRVTQMDTEFATSRARQFASRLDEWLGDEPVI